MFSVLEVNRSSLNECCTYSAAGSDQALPTIVSAMQSSRVTAEAKACRTKSRAHSSSRDRSLDVGPSHSKLNCVTLRVEAW